MAVQQWSERVLVADLADDPQFSEDLAALLSTIDQHRDHSVALNFANCTFINSSNISKLLKLRKALQSHGRHLILCGLSDRLWSVFLTTGLDRIFEFESNIATGLAKLQLTE